MIFFNIDLWKIRENPPYIDDKGSPHPSNRIVRSNHNTRIAVKVFEVLFPPIEVLAGALSLSPAENHTNYSFSWPGTKKKQPSIDKQ